MAVKLLRWGNSAGIRLPQVVLQGAGLTVGDYSEVRLLDTGDIRLRPLKGARPIDKLPEPPHIKVPEAKW
jgi:antitoxin MazE